jgi:hypothetical protein
MKEGAKPADDADTVSHSDSGVRALHHFANHCAYTRGFDYQGGLINDIDFHYGLGERKAA